MGETHLKNMVSSSKENKGGVAISRAMQIAGNPDFPPSTTEVTSSASKCSAKRCAVLPEYLQDKFFLPQSDMLRYFQIRHYITNHADWNIIKNAPTNIETYFINITKHQIPNKTMFPICTEGFY